jgi:hypothetical protein
MVDGSAFQRDVLASSLRLLAERPPVAARGSVEPIEVTSVSLAPDPDAGISLFFRALDQPERIFGFRFPVDDERQAEGWSPDAWASVLLTNWEEALATSALPPPGAEGPDQVTWIE